MRQMLGYSILPFGKRNLGSPFSSQNTLVRTQKKIKDIVVVMLASSKLAIYAEVLVNYVFRMFYQNILFFLGYLHPGRDP